MKTMVFTPTTSFHLGSSPATLSHIPPSTGSNNVVIKGATFLCKAISKSSKQEMEHIVRKQQSFIQQNDIMKDDEDMDKIVYPSNKIKGFAERIKAILHSLDEGEINMSAYDTAWVALVQDVNGSGRPQFPSCMEWIVNSQLPDGSWGVKFLKENISKLEDDNEEHMLIGFEVAFPSLIDIARTLNIEVSEDSPVLEEIYARRNLKLTKIPNNIMQKVPTPLLYSLEGMPNLEWEKLLKLQSKEGSFLFSPSSTAFALMETKDEKCLQYLTNVVTKFNGGVPTAYPLDLFERIWIVDRLQRLGISRYFKSEIDRCIEYIYRHWTKDGICWARNSNVQDIDDTSMGFRVLRMYGYEISPDVFRQFEKDGKFVCFVGQTTQPVTGMLSLLRASQILFPGEKILEDANKFSYNYLKEKQSKNELLDKWIIAKDLPGEVGYALDVPWYMSLPRLETRFYLDQYGGEDDVWIGKTLYRMGNVSNNTYLEMAKLDYNNCLALHQLEWNTIQQWYVDFNIERFGMSDITSLLVAYYLAAASVFEPERSNERIAWAKTTTLVDAISSFFDSLQFSNKHRRYFVDEFRNTPSSLHPTKYAKPWHGLMVALRGTLHELAAGALMAHGRDVHSQLHHVWEMWLTGWQEGIDATEGQAELIVQTMSLINGRCTFKELLAHSQYQRLSTVTNNLCHEISRSHKSDKENRTTCFDSETTYVMRMQELVQLVLNNSPDDLDRDFKQTFLTVAKTFFYKAYYDSVTINAHISRVLFETVI